MTTPTDEEIAKLLRRLSSLHREWLKAAAEQYIHGGAEAVEPAPAVRPRTAADCAPCPRRCVECPDPPDHHWYSAYAELEPDHPAAKAGRSVWLTCKHDEQCSAWIDVPEDYDGI